MLSSERSRHVQRVPAAAVALLVAAVVAVVGSALILGRVPTQRPGRVSSSGEGDYPDSWRTSLVQARSSSIFDLIVPDDPSANAGAVTEVFISPDASAVAMRFPPPAQLGADPVRQDFIEVYETPWNGGDPADAWAEDVKKSDIVGESVIEISRIPALSVAARSPSDLEAANPAFLRFVYKDLDVQISGGDDLDLLIEIAKSMVDT